MNSASHRTDAIDARSQRGPTRIGDWVLYPDLGVVRRDQDEVRLNAKTLHVLLVLLDSGEQGVSRDELLDKVWGYGHEGYEHTVNSHINRLRAKIEDNPSHPEMIVTVWGVGYKFAA